MKQRLWWQKPLRVIQDNLQVKDTGKMDPEKIAQDISDMAGNTFVVNVGGIYAWYDSKVKYHHVNEYLPEGRDLLREIIDGCHKRDIRVIARFDFSKTDDYVFQEKPQWFVRNADKTPRVYGKDRPGDWSMLLSTCLNAGYRNDELAVPVINEVLDMYDIDGIFFNAPQYELCFCDTCKRKYKETYGKELPFAGKITGNFIEGMEADWPSLCKKDNIDVVYKAVKSREPDMPVVLYYDIYGDNLDARIATADMICTESQDVLSRGYREIPQFWKPALTMKVGRSIDDYPLPFGIIHSCPGMDWRHTGLPTDEYRFWMSQIPANGGSIWHSITGFNDTITDKRIIDSVSYINHMIAKSEDYMDCAKEISDTLLLWDGQKHVEGWAEALINKQVLFSVLSDYHITLKKLNKYENIIAPENFKFDNANAKIIKEYVRGGGNLIVEGTSYTKLAPVLDILGIDGDIVSSEFLTASYFNFEDCAGGLKNTFERTQLLPHRGIVAYCKPKSDAKVLATLVPPFAPLDGVGSPPERASMNVSKTDLPLCILSKYGSGKVMFLPFQLGMLVKEFKLNEHYQLIKNCVDMLNDNKRFTIDGVNGLEAMLYKKHDTWLLHLVNGIGQRPLVSMIPYHDLRFTLKLDTGKRIKSVKSVIADMELEYEVIDDAIHCTLSRLDVWDMIAIETE